MKRPQYALASLTQIVTWAILALGAVVQAQDKKADPTGTWTWTTPGRNRGPDRISTLKLKVEGDKLTGTLAAPVCAGHISNSPIAYGKPTGEAIVFWAI